MTQMVGLDFEFFNANEKNMSVVCSAMHDYEQTTKWNLTNPWEVEQFKYELHINKDKIFLAYAVIAEARALESLGIDPLQFKWIDLYVEFRMLCNSNNLYKYGNYISDDGSVRFSTPPIPNVEDKLDHKETPKNLVNAVYKMVGVRLDTEEKDTMRQLILSKDMTKIKENMESILDYCASDVKYLLPLYEAICKAYENEGLSDFQEDQLSRGRYAAAVSKSETIGIPINTVLLNKVIEKTPEILEVHKTEVNSFFPFFSPEYQRPSTLLKNGKTKTFKPTKAKKNMAEYQKYIESLKIPEFPKTETGKYKIDSETLEEWGYWVGLEALWKYKKTEDSLKWFNKENGNGFFERMGSDNRVRPYYGIFGTQTGRNAAKAKTFPLAMSTWLRAIVQPEKKYSIENTNRDSNIKIISENVIIGADFSQQEVYVAAILSGDYKLLEAYNSGDVYLAFAKQAGMVPENATKKTHEAERDLCKSTVLGLQYGMGKFKLQTKLKLDTKTDVSMETTEMLINSHKTVFKIYWEWVKRITEMYKAGVPLITSDGFCLFLDNPVIPSVRNFLVQGTSASICRLAVVMAWEQDLKVMCSLHDALYIISENSKKDEQLLVKIMKEATKIILKEDVTTIRIDTKIIGHNDVWVEKKGQEDWDKIKEFLI